MPICSCAVWQVPVECGAEIPTIKQEDCQIIPQPEREQPNCLTVKILDQVFIMWAKEGLRCSQFEAEALTGLGQVSLLPLAF